ncbi:MAG: dipeptide epimerase [Saprospiraceae bacterium]|jgi:L-alanine-DL-glutamate epimerase-like enolase superfamily enzyme|nr:dipeptide epimerase [Saprospiraceae bacterium]MDB4505755.1 dipeptide epimerase [Saprospiraceae bacterium]MDG1435002.1 dipeptide epimerase [Saprospiraceae bacterium]MDG2418790.1 dipeptide epimerase [Saprospiraceae bacterium]
MKLHLHRFQLETKTPFKLSRVTYNVRELLVVELEEDGFSGFGEASDHSFYDVKIEEIWEVLENLKPIIEAYEFDTPEQFWEEMNSYLKDHSFAQCALDVAAHDLFGKKMGKPLYELWGLKLENLPITDYTVGIDTPEKMVEKMRAKPWSVYKIKLGVPEDLEIMKALRAATDVPFRIDANCGWTVKEAIEKSVELKKLGVEFIEQPLRGGEFDEMKDVYEKSALPVFADESCVSESDVKKCVGRFHGINIKLMKCGGLTPARRMIEEARKLGLQVMAGCMMESSIGISAVAQLLPLLDYIDMDSILLIKKDIAEGVKILENGEVVFPEENGIGVKLLS